MGLPVFQSVATSGEKPQKSETVTRSDPQMAGTALRAVRWGRVLLSLDAAGHGCHHCHPSGFGIAGMEGILPAGRFGETSLPEEGASQAATWTMNCS